MAGRELDQEQVAGLARRLTQALPVVLGRSLGGTELDGLLIYLRQLALWSQSYNLTALDICGNAFFQHLVSCCHFVPLVSLSGAVVVDLGAGNGILGMLLAILKADCRQVYLVDSVKKKVLFLRYVIAELHLQDRVTAWHIRAEELPGRLTGSCDYVVSKAFCDFRQGAIYAQPLLREGGQYLMVKGDRASQDLLEFQQNPIAEFYALPVIHSMQPGPGSILATTLMCRKNKVY